MDLGTDGVRVTADNTVVLAAALGDIQECVVCAAAKSVRAAALIPHSVLYLHFFTYTLISELDPPYNL